VKKKTLHMIGNAHIDPVWLWQLQEGFQEVKSTFRDLQAGHQGQDPAPQMGQGDRGRLRALRDQDVPRPQRREPARNRDELARMRGAGRVSLHPAYSGNSTRSPTFTPLLSKKPWFTSRAYWAGLAES
jgi:hypothetical protein